MADTFEHHVNAALEREGYGPAKWHHPINQDILVASISKGGWSASITATGRDLVECHDMLDVLANARVMGAIEALEKSIANA